MSKPMTRVVFSVLICLAIVAAMYTVVYGASLLRAGVAGGRVPANAGLTSVVGSNRYSAIQSYYADVEKPGRMHDCEFDSGFDPDD